jgi:hypothetical protein
VSKNSTRRQHWVPQFYLKWFATSESRTKENPRVWVYFKGHTPKQIAISNIAAESYIYSPLDTSGQRHDGVEHWLGELEDNCAPVWNSLAESDFDFGPHNATKYILASFVAVQATRIPKHRDFVSNLHERLVEEFDRLPKDLHGRPEISSLWVGDKVIPLDRSGWESFRDASEEEIKRMFLDQLLGFRERLIPMILGKRWSMIRAPEPGFVTSDCPVCFPNGQDVRKPAIILLPLSPTRLLQLDDNHKLPSGLIYNASPERVLELNKQIFQGIDRFLISHEDPTPLLRQLA